MAHINLDNFNTVTRNAWKQRDAAGNWPAGNIGWPTKVGEYTHPDLPKYPKLLSFGNAHKGEAAGTIRVVGGQEIFKLPNARRSGASVSGRSSMASGAAGAMLAVNAINWSLEQYGIYQNNEDKSLVREHTDILRKQIARDGLPTTYRQYY